MASTRDTTAAARPKAARAKPAAPPEIDAKALITLARKGAAHAPARLLAQIDEFASMGRWAVLPAVATKGAWQPAASFVVVEGGVLGGKVVVHDGLTISGW